MNGPACCRGPGAVLCFWCLSANGGNESGGIGHDVEIRRNGWVKKLQIFKDTRDLYLECGKIIVCGIPYFVHIDTEVLVDEEVAHGNDIFPWDFFVLLLKIPVRCRLQLPLLPECDREPIPGSGRMRKNPL